MLAMRSVPSVVAEARSGDWLALKRWWRASVHVVSARYGIGEASLKSMRRNKEIVTPRRRAIAAIRIATGCPYVPLSRAIGCDHTTAILAVKSMENDAETISLADELTKLIADGWDLPPPDWKKLAIANGWHPSTECRMHRDDHGGGEL